MSEGSGDAAGASGYLQPRREDDPADVQNPAVRADRDGVGHGGVGHDAPVTEEDLRELEQQDEDFRRSAERLARLEADRVLVEELAREDFEGPSWQRYAEELAAYGRAVIFVWLVTGDPDTGASLMSASTIASVGTGDTPWSAIRAAVASSIEDPCSMPVTPAWIAFRMPALLCACAVTYVPRADASWTATAISSTVNCVSFSVSCQETTPPVTDSLRKSAPRRNASLTFLRISSGLSDITASALSPGMLWWQKSSVGSHAAAA